MSAGSLTGTLTIGLREFDQGSPVVAPTPRSVPHTVRLPDGRSAGMSSAAGPLLSPRKCMTGPSPVGLTSVRDPDGDMRAARLGHRCAVPVGPAIAQSKTRETSHEAKLGGPHVAQSCQNGHPVVPVRRTAAAWRVIPSAVLPPPTGHQGRGSVRTGRGRAVSRTARALCYPGTSAASPAAGVP